MNNMITIVECAESFNVYVDGEKRYSMELPRTEDKVAWNDMEAIIDFCTNVGLNLNVVRHR